MNYVEVSLDYEHEDPAAHGDAADGDAVGDAADGDAVGDAADGDADGDAADGDAAASNTSDVLPGFVRESAAAARAVAASAKSFLNVSTSSSSTIAYEDGGEEVEISRFTALSVNPRMTSSPRPGRTGSGSRSSPSPTPPRQKFTCEQKNLARELKKDGKQPQEIIEIFKQRYGVVLKSSTLSTWYNTTNMANHERRGPTNTSMASVETHVNPTQRPTILIDMEFALVSMIKKYDNIVSVTRKGTLSKMGKSLFDKLRALDIYEDSGA